MFGWCRHPAGKLAVKKDATIKKKGDDFNIVTYHLFCQSCGKDVDIKYAQMTKSVKEFLSPNRRMAKRG